jgi:N-acetylmuramoyl-L-alanine amidase
MKRIATFVLGLLAASFCLAYAQPKLVVNGSEVAAVDSALIPGTSFVAAEPYANAIGATFRFDAAQSLASFEFGGRLATLRIYTNAEEAAADSQALRLDGRPATSPGGVLRGGTIYVPIRHLAQAFGATVANVPERDMVVVLFERARMSEVEPPRHMGDYDRLVIDLNRPAPIRVHVLDTGVWRLRFERTDAARGQSFSGGDHYRTIYLSPERGWVDIEFTLEPARRLEWYATPRGRGVSVTIDIVEVTDEGQPGGQQAPFVILDPGHGGDDTGIVFPGVGSESALTYSFARRLAAALEQHGLRASLTRDEATNVPLATRSALGATGDFFISIHGAPRAVGQVHIYYLGDATDPQALALAVRENAAATVPTLSTDSLRRQILLGLVPDLAAGERVARELARTLGAQPGVTVTTSATPLYVLFGAAGRGVLLELSPSDLDSEAFVARVAAAVASSLLAWP